MCCERPISKQKMHLLAVLFTHTHTHTHTPHITHTHTPHTTPHTTHTPHTIYDDLNHVGTEGITELWYVETVAEHL